MLLIITHKQDYTADYVINELNRRELHYYRFNCEDIQQENITLSFDKRAICNLFGQTRFHSVWFRRTKLPDIEGVTPPQKIYLIGEWQSYLSNLIASVSAEKWLSEPRAIDFAENKAVQLRVAMSVGWLLPETLISCDRNKVIDFYRCQPQTVIKPLHSSRVTAPRDDTKIIFTNLLTEEHISQIDAFEMTPAIYQRFIPKQYELRITIVNQKVFAARVDSASDEATQVDWRKKRLKFFPYVLPPDIQEKCLALTKKLNLAFGAIDVIRGTDGQYYFLEINPNGQWVWIEKDTHLPIADAIINYLYAE